MKSSMFVFSCLKFFFSATSQLLILENKGHGPQEIVFITFNLLYRNSLDSRLTSQSPILHLICNSLFILMAPKLVSGAAKRSMNECLGLL